MADHNKPTITSAYADFVSELDARLDDLAIQNDPAFTTVTNPVTNEVRWSSVSNKWNKWNGTSWVDLSTTYSINVASADKLNTARTINGTSFDGTGNITVNTNSALTFNNSGTGATSGSTFNGGSAVTISYNSIGAQAALGFTPVQQNGGAGQLTNKLYIGWLGSNLGLQVDTTNYGSSWPISITGSAASATNASTLAGVTPTSAGLALLDDVGAAAQRSTLGLGSAATLTAGTSANNVVQLDGSAKIPAIDGSQLTNLPTELPTQTGNSGKYLTTNGSVVSWGTVSNGGFTAVTPIATTSGTSAECTTIPSTATQVTVILKGVSGNSIGGVGLLQAGPSSGVATTGYAGGSSIIRNAGATTVSIMNTTTNCLVDLAYVFGGNVGYTIDGTITLYKTSPSENDWSYSGTFFGREVGELLLKMDIFGTTTFTGPLSRIKLTATIGSLDAGTMRVVYQ